MELMPVVRRFFAVRGLPALMISDNGSQMVGAERELQAMVEGLNTDRLKEFCADKGMKWQFATPAAPHQNGCAEALVKNSKGKESLKDLIESFYQGEETQGSLWQIQPPCHREDS